MQLARDHRSLPLPVGLAARGLWEQQGADIAVAQTIERELTATDRLDQCAVFRRIRTERRASDNEASLSCSVSFRTCSANSVNRTCTAHRYDIRPLRLHNARIVPRNTNRSNPVSLPMPCSACLATDCCTAFPSCMLRSCSSQASLLIRMVGRRASFGCGHQAAPSALRASSSGICAEIHAWRMPQY